MTLDKERKNFDEELNKLIKEGWKPQGSTAKIL